MPRRAIVVTVSDRVHRRESEDRSGPVAASWLEDRGFEVIDRRIVPDEADEIAVLLRRLVDERSPDLILTTGGTGFSPRDVTPEATLPLLERRAPGIEEALRRGGLDKGIAAAVLGRGVSGIRSRTWIINLPGSPRAVVDGLEAIAGVMEHALDQLERGAPHDGA
ncbi:MAG: MogA/MoaB family molybdenum cofactor biosynthesis protein [Candidatus Latescibacterota bacterium]|nr:MAG: MogA/MoaB family molybdenum cofactor biosynthesis protein [Candidatus Latescibacterota bacterium]